MRIVRPGSVVGPQQQYMYLKQLEWTKWAAVDEMKKAQKAAVVAATALVTPATPPADEESDDMITEPTGLPIVIPSTPPPKSMPPVTPSRHVAAAQAKAGAILPPGQPRKTPAPKRVATDSDEDNDDVPPLSDPPIRRLKAKPVSARVAGTRLTAAEQRSARITRSTASSTAKKAAPTPVPLPTAVKPARANGQAPNKVPRLAGGTSARGNVTKSTTLDVPALGTRSKARQLTTPTPSRLPVAAKRPGHRPTGSVQETPASLTAMGVPPTSWMSKDAAAVVVAAPKSGRPGLRPIRRRRSSFSAADVVA